MARSPVMWRSGEEPSPGVTTAQFREHGLGAEDEEIIRAHLERAPTFAELGVFSVLWSEHCAYRTTRALLTTLPTRSPRVVHGPGENAGVVDVGDGLCLVFKIESHNHPSMIEPFHGAATGVGGILRDVFTMGARPFASGIALRLGLRGTPASERIIQGVIAGIGAYGNAIGVPTVTCDLAFDEAFADNVLVNAFACGVVRREHLVLGRTGPPGSVVLLLGSPTGADGIHGATMASASFGKSAAKAPRTVQVGDPFAGKRLLSACVALARSGLLLGMQDLGAAGLSSSTVEMAARSGTGMAIDLSAVPRRSAGLRPYDLLLSETQERMVATCHPANLDAVKTIAAAAQVPLAVIGEVLVETRWIVREGPDEALPVCDLDVAFLAGGAPPRVFPRAEGERAARQDHVRETPRDLLEQLDAEVGGATLLASEGDAAVLRVVEGSVQKLVALAVGASRFATSGYEVGFSAVMEACLRVCVVGGVPLALSDGLNFGSPSEPSVMSDLAECIRGMAEACLLLSVPIVSGNVSLSNQTDGRAIPPCPFVVAVGLLPHERALARSRFSAAGVPLWLVSAEDERALPDLVAFLGALSRGGVPRVAHLVPGRDLDLGIAQMSERLDVLDVTYGAQLFAPRDSQNAGTSVLIATEADLLAFSAEKELFVRRVGETVSR